MTSSSADRESKTGKVTVMALLAAAVCCGLPFLVAAGSSVTLLGVGFRSWLLAAAGLTATVAAVVLAVRARRQRDALDY